MRSSGQSAPASDSSALSKATVAKADWRAGRMKLPDLDNAEFTPLPPDAQPLL
jgi:hypothetical protein